MLPRVEEGGYKVRKAEQSHGKNIPAQTGKQGLMICFQCFNCQISQLGRSWTKVDERGDDIHLAGG